jgi:hypothetical protein
MTEADEQPKTKKTRTIYVFSVTNHSGPLVTELPDNEEGHATLANMVRVETVMAAVLGEKVNTELASVVTVTLPGRKAIVDRMPIEAGHG